MEVKTKFQLGDKVWALENGKAISFEIKSISLCVSVSEDYGYTYYNSDESGIASGRSIVERKCFASKQELVESIFGSDTVVD